MRLLIPVKDEEAERDKLEQAELEQQSDALLLLNDSARDEEAPAYSERYLRARDRRRGDIQLEHIPEERFAAEPDLQQFRDIQFREMQAACRWAGVPARYRIALDAWMHRQSLREIGLMLGVSDHTAAKDIHRAAKAIQGYPYLGLETVLAEIFGMSVGKLRALLKRE